ncbi:MAG: fructose-bisphosphate aldolase class I [Pseudonocardiales bacterium]|nr:MAG: fructose-bisphosphate aldolase class I [Pseudonocardiales bacterium]
MPGLHEVATALVAPGKGILAADESIGTMSKRLEGVGVAATEGNRRDYRELLLTTTGLDAWISGIILSTETLGQQLADGTPFGEAAPARGVMAGIKVDTGTHPLPFSDGTVTEGLDGLRARLEQYRGDGAVFAKWRAALAPVGLSARTIRANAHALARYAALCQEAGIVPIVEPEVLMDGDHPIETCETATTETLQAVFAELDAMGVDPAGIVLKPNMIVSGAESPHQADPDEVARRTVQVLSAAIPPTVPGVAFLSGGQSNEQACANLAAINARAATVDGAPWRLTFSFGRALVNDALQAWAGVATQVAAAQNELAGNCQRASQATASVAAPAGT